MQVRINSKGTAQSIPIDEETRRRIAEAYPALGGVRTVAKLFNVSRESVRLIAHANGSKMRPPHGVPRT